MATLKPTLLKAALSIACCIAGAAAHTDPTNLEAVECAIFLFAQEFGAAKFPAASNEISDALHSALLLDRCRDLAPSHTSGKRAGGVADQPRLGGYPQSSRPDAWYAVGGGSRTSGPSLYVSLSGNDSNPGTFAAPFATLQRAQSEIRTSPVGARASTTVYVRQGTYYLRETLSFGPEDSGNSHAERIVWRPYQNESVTISGGIKLDLDWQPYVGNFTAGKAFAAKLPDGVPTNFTTFFADNTRAIRARFPNGNPGDVTGQCFSKVQFPQHGEGCHGYATAAGGTTVNLPPAIRVTAQTPIPNLPARYGAYPSFDMMVRFMTVCVTHARQVIRTDTYHRLQVRMLIHAASHRLSRWPSLQSVHLDALLMGIMNTAGHAFRSYGHAFTLSPLAWERNAGRPCLPLLNPLWLSGKKADSLFYKIGS